MSMTKRLNDELGQLVRRHTCCVIAADGSGQAATDTPIGYGGFVLVRDAEETPFRLLAPVLGGLQYGGSVNLAELLGLLFGMKLFHDTSHDHTQKFQGTFKDFQGLSRTFKDMSGLDNLLRIKGQRLAVDLLTDSAYTAQLINRVIEHGYRGRVHEDMALPFWLYAKMYDIRVVNIPRDTFLLNKWSDLSAAIARDYMISAQPTQVALREIPNGHTFVPGVRCRKSEGW